MIDRAALAVGLLTLSVAVSAPAGAQQRDRDTIQGQVIDQFMNNLRQQAGMDDEQFERFRLVAQRGFAERRRIQNGQRRILRDLQNQMRPGVAADVDSVEVLIEVLLQSRQATVDYDRAEQEELAEFLTPVQRAQVVMQLSRLQQRIEQMIRQRMQQSRDRNN